MVFMETKILRQVTVTRFGTKRVHSVHPNTLDAFVQVVALHDKGRADARVERVFVVGKA